MKYALVATTSYLLLVDLESKLVTALENERPEYYGISWFAGDDEVVLSHSGVNNSDLIDIASYAQSEKGWISKGPRGSKKLLSAPHQILCAPDRRVICTNTGRNVISVIDLDQLNFFQEAGISDARWDRLSLEKITGDHLNSVFFHDDQLFVVAHGHNKGSKLAIFSYPNLDLISVSSLGQRTGLHNIWITSEGQRISCHSETGSLIDIDSEEPLWESGSPVYTRGLAATREYVLVGESQKTGRDLRRGSLSAVWILDRNNWRAIDYLCLGPYGAVNEVRLLDVPDEAHHGVPLNNIQKFLDKYMLEDNRKNKMQEGGQKSWLPVYAQAELGQSRLQAARAVLDGRVAWSSYHLVLGSPEILQDGNKRAAVDSLCLALKQSVENETTEKFSYALEAGQVSHVSAVLGYRGSGGDTHMAAILIQSSGKKGALSAWRHDGEVWRQLPEFKTVFGLPMQGDFYLDVTPSTAIVCIGDAEVLRLEASTLGLDYCNKGLGIRWMGATVKPLD